MAGAGGRVGRGRLPNILGTQDSRETISCPVPNCEVRTRADHLKTRHFMTVVKFDIEGNPVSKDSDSFQQLSEEEKKHTIYWIDNDLTRTKLPILKRKSISSSVNPFSLAKRKSSNVESVGDKEDEPREVPDRLSPECSELPDVGMASDDGRDVSFSSIDIGGERPPTLPINSSDDDQDNDSEDHIEIPNTETVTSNTSELLSNIKDEISKQLGIDDGENFADKVAERVVYRLKEMEKKPEREMSVNWLETETDYICQDCVAESDSVELPQPLRRYKKGKYGAVSKNQNVPHINQAMLSHETNPLHIWCLTRADKKNEKKAKDKEKSKAAATMIVTNIVYCLKNSESSATFRKLCDKDQLIPEISSSCSTKNDGRQMYWVVKDLVFDSLSDTLVECMAESTVLAVTLDKVTVGSVAYTVILSYFWYKGAIHCVLNKIHVMTSDEFDGEGTAEFLVSTLLETLRISKSTLANKLKHLVYDGVYEDPQFRTRGGGGLNLPDHVSRLLGVESGTITGHWDLGHKLQLVYGDVFLKDVTFIEDEKFIIDIMSDFKKHKKGLIFKEVAEELLHPVLENKGRRQNTRWVRSELVLLESFLRNLPTLYNVMGREEQKLAMQMNLTEQKIVKKKMKKMTDGSFLARLVGYSQILNGYAKASLSCQYSGRFASSVMKDVNSEADTLQSGSQQFDWEDEPLKYAGIGTPTHIIDNLKAGIFQPFVTKQAKQRRARLLNVERSHRREVLANLGDDEEIEEVHDTLSWINRTENLTSDDIVVGEIPVENFTEDEENKVKEKMRETCSDLKDSLEERRTDGDMSEVSELLAGKFEWFHPNLLAQDGEGYNDQIDELRIKVGRLNELVGDVSEEGGDNDMALFIGYLRWATLFKEKKTSKDVLDEDIWKEYWKLASVRDEMKPFVKAFEYLQIKSYSEAIAETVGSVMVMAKAKSRNCEPVNFAKEIFCRFNLPPLHICRRKMIPTIAEDLLTHLQFHRKLERSRFAYKLKYKDMSASVGNFRAKEEEKSIIPCDFFT